MRKRPRARPTSLLLPDHFPDPPAAVAEASDAYAAALKSVREAGEAVRESGANLRSAKGEDAAPSVIRKREHAIEDAEHKHREAKRHEAKARAALAAGITRESRALIEQLPIEERYQRVLGLAQEFASELDRLADEVGSIRTIATIDQERTQARGFEPIRSNADRFQKPQDHLAALVSRANELRDLARDLSQQLAAPSGPERQEVAA